jgi:hypothetical protein
MSSCRPQPRKTTYRRAAPAFPPVTSRGRRSLGRLPRWRVGLSRIVPGHIGTRKLTRTGRSLGDSAIKGIRAVLFVSSWFFMTQENGNYESRKHTLRSPRGITGTEPGALATGRAHPSLTLRARTEKIRDRHNDSGQQSCGHWFGGFVRWHLGCIFISPLANSASAPRPKFFFPAVA